MGFRFGASLLRGLEGCFFLINGPRMFIKSDDSTLNDIRKNDMFHVTYKRVCVDHLP